MRPKKNYYIKKEVFREKKWKIKEGGYMDSTIFSDGERDINFDQYLKEIYK